MKNDAEKFPIKLKLTTYYSRGAQTVQCITFLTLCGPIFFQQIYVIRSKVL